jgi:hypothetical protein
MSGIYKAMPTFSTVAGVDGPLFHQRSSRLEYQVEVDLFSKPDLKILNEKKVGTE